MVLSDVTSYFQPLKKRKKNKKEKEKKKGKELTGVSIIKQNLFVVIKSFILQFEEMIPLFFE